MNLPDFIESKREEIREIAYRHGARNVRLFGSMVRGQGRENSDVDLLVDVGPRTTAWFPAGMIVDLEDLLGRGVDVVAEAALHPMLRENVLREAVSL
ncbi:MAG: nucleotidyltransferase family protein [Acidobacteriota bacterium]